MNSLFDNPELMRLKLEQEGFFSLPPEMQPAALAQLLPKMLPQSQAQQQNWLSQFVNGGLVKQPQTAPRAKTPQPTYGIRG